MDVEHHAHSSAHEHLFFIGYIAIGGFLTLANSVILLAIICTREVRARKEFVLIAGLCVVDLLVSLGFLLAALFRLTLPEDFPSLIPRYACNYHVFHYLIAIGYPLVGSMCVVQAVDRLFAIRTPIRYAQWTTNYGFAMISVPILLSAVGMMINVYFTRNSQDLIDAFCYTATALCPFYGRLIAVVRMTSCLFAMLLYADFYLRLRTRFKNLSSALQSRITITIGRPRSADRKISGLTTLNAFIFMFIPDLFIVSDLGEMRTRYGVVFYIAVLVKLFLDFVVLFCRHDELRKAISKIFLPWTERVILPIRHLSKQRASKTHQEELAMTDSEIFL